MGYTMLNHPSGQTREDRFHLEGAALAFLRDRCEGLRFNRETTEAEQKNHQYQGSSLHKGDIPYNMQMDIDRLCLENALRRFLGSGRKEDAFDVYFCYLEMFVGDYRKTRRVIELLSEFEANGSKLLMKHRDHYVHSVYVFALGLAIYHTNSIYRKTYQDMYQIPGDSQAACHFLQFWGLAALFHDIGYPFELPFEQLASYFEVNGDSRKQRPYVAYRAMEPFVKIDRPITRRLAALCGGAIYETTDELFAGLLAEKFSKAYLFTEAQMLQILRDKPAHPNRFGHFMDHAYFSATVLFKKLFCELECPLQKEHLDALSAILAHNSLYKFSIAYYKDEDNLPLQASLHPLAYLLMLCDELQCWDRVAYGRNSKRELHPMDCRFDFHGDQIRVVYLYDERESGKVDAYKAAHKAWKDQEPDRQDQKLHKLWKDRKPRLKAFDGMYEIDKNNVSCFQADIERIVDLSGIRLHVSAEPAPNKRQQHYLSDSTFLSLYHFAVALNARWDSDEWRKAKDAGQEEAFLLDERNLQRFSDAFQALSLEYKLSNINQAKAFARYMEEINCFYTDRSVSFEMLEEFAPDELETIGKLEHQRWLQEHYDMGWTYGEPDRAQRDLVRQHKDLIPNWSGETVSEDAALKNYTRLDKAEQDKDTEPMKCMLSLLRMFDGLRIYKLR